MDKWKEFFRSLEIFIAALITLFATYFVSWAFTSIIIWIVFQVCKFTYSLKLATAIWVIFTLWDLFARIGSWK